MMIDTNTKDWKGGYDLSDAGYELADKISPWLDAHPGLHTPSVIARGVKSSSNDVWQVLLWLEKHVEVAADGNGKWRKYGARR